MVAKDSLKAFPLEVELLNVIKIGFRATEMAGRNIVALFLVFGSAFLKTFSYCLLYCFILFPPTLFGDSATPFFLKKPIKNLLKLWILKM